MKSARFDLHGVGLEISADDEALVDGIGARLRHFRHAGPGPADVVFRYRTVPRDGTHSVERPHGESRPVYDPPAGEVLYFPDDDVFFVDYEDRVRIRCECGNGRVDVSVAEPERGNLWLLTRPFFTLPLIEVLKRRGLYSVHAAGVAHAGGAIIFPASTGAGKTTLAVALAQAGFGLLADDMLFLSAEADPVYPFPDELDLHERTLGWFPELRDAAEVGEGFPKHRLDPSQAGTVHADPLPPAAVFFPRISGGTETSAERIDAAAALQELVPNVLLTDPAASQCHLSALGALVERCPCYRLDAAQDFKRLGELVAELAVAGR